MYDHLFPPIEHIKLAIEDRKLQKRHIKKHPKKLLGPRTFKCQSCRMDPQKLKWYYFESPAGLLELLAGEGGWLTYCPDCDHPVQFFREWIS